MRSRWTRVITVMAACVAFAAVPMSSVGAIPNSPRPLFMAGGQCDEGSPYVKYKVKNIDTVAHTLVIKVDGLRVVGPVPVAAGGSVKGRFVYTVPPTNSKTVIAKWKDTAVKAKLRFRTNDCDGGEARGPWFIAGQYCSAAGKNRVKFTIENTKPTPQPINVKVTNSVNQNSEKLWPNNADFVVMQPDIKVTKKRTIPEHYGPGDQVRVRGWLVNGDSGAHNRVVFNLFDCG